MNAHPGLPSWAKLRRPFGTVAQSKQEMYVLLGVFRFGFPIWNARKPLTATVKCWLSQNLDPGGT